MLDRDWYETDEECRNARIEFYTMKKREREGIYFYMKRHSEDKEYIRNAQERLDNFDPWDEYEENRPDWNLVDRISYDEIGDYIDRGLLP